MTEALLPVRSVEQLCRHLGSTPAGLKALVAGMPFRFHKYPKKSRSGKVRHIYNPKEELRAVQGPLDDLLRQIPVSDAAHGWRRGRSPRTNAAGHVGKAIVIRMDLEDFFPSCHYERVRRLFSVLGCSDEVAELLMHLTTADYHLPQGFLTSPTIANLLLARMDRRLEGLAAQRGANYSRFGDDLSLSGDRSTVKMIPLINSIIGEAGHRLNAKKFADGGVRSANQRQEICAVTVNRKVNLRKSDYRRYRDLIHRCVVHGPAGEMRGNETPLQMKERVQGYVNYVRGINREAARGLQEKFDQIAWAP